MQNIQLGSMFPLLISDHGCLNCPSHHGSMRLDLFVFDEHEHFVDTSKAHSTSFTGGDCPEDNTQRWYDIYSHIIIKLNYEMKGLFGLDKTKSYFESRKRRYPEIGRSHQHYHLSIMDRLKKKYEYYDVTLLHLFFIGGHHHHFLPVCNLLSRCNSRSQAPSL